MANFSDAVTNLVEADSSNMKKAKQSMQKNVDAESHDVHKNRHTDYHWSFGNDVSFKHILRRYGSSISLIMFSFKRKETKHI